jgi:hypothetical protein|tara:strand:- start:652 stop:1116 length:465 start_codon:yes stop_codon:yes gene_type:complete
MENTGTFDGTIALWIMICFTLPIALAILGRIAWAVFSCVEAFVPLVQMIRVQAPACGVQREKIVYRDREKIVYRDRVKPQKTTASTAPIVSVPPPLPTISTPITDSKIISDTVSALKGLGFQVADIKIAIKDLCSSRVYLDTEKLVRDCLGQLK